MMRKLGGMDNEKKIYSSWDEAPVTLCADDISALLGISRAGAYTLMRQEGFPIIQIGKRMVVPKNKLLTWMDEQLRDGTN